MLQKIFNSRMAKCLFNNLGVSPIERLKSMLQDNGQQDHLRMNVAPDLNNHLRSSLVISSHRYSSVVIGSHKNNSKTYYI